MSTRRASALKFQVTTKDSADFRTWFRGEYTNGNPHLAHLLSEDAVDKYVLHGWKPEAPVITPETQITAFGSCFAANISNYLSQRNYNVLNKDRNAKRAYVVGCGEGMVNSFVIRQQFEWAWENKVFDQPLWHGYKAEEYGYDAEVQATTKEIFDNTDVFILTFGLSEIWYDEPTGNVFWRTIPKESYDPERHKFRVSTVEENKDNLRAIYDLIRKHRPDAKIIYTLSPIPLLATFRNNSCITSNSVSKSVLRVAIDEVIREKQEEGVLHYWPSYEIITDVFRQPYKPDRRHPYEEVLDYIMMLFEKTWCIPHDNEEADRPDIKVGFAKALVAARLVPGVITRVIAKDKDHAINRLLARDQIMDEPKSERSIRRFLKSFLKDADAA